MQATLEACGISFPELLSFAPWLFLYISIFAFIADILFSTRPDTSEDPYEPNPGTKWFFQLNPKLRSGEEPPPNDEMKEELALFQTDQGEWPSWYIDWNFQTGTWDWAKGWRREGLPPMSKRLPTMEGQRWYLQQDSKDRRPDEPPPNQQMVAEELLYNYDQGPWPPWYLTSELKELAEGVPVPASPVWVWGREWKRDGVANLSIPKTPPPKWQNQTDASTAGKTVSSFLAVYSLIMMADWIQGPYVYAIYKELQISESKITMLFSADSIAAFVTGKFTGLFTDRLGRKRACQMFCVAYTLNCCSMVISTCWGVNMSVLIAGRLFRGIATNLLYSAFESWFISQYDFLKLRKLGYNIGRVFGYLTVIKGSSAFLAGILSEILVQYTGYKAYTMVVSGVLFAIAWLIIAFTWDENYGIPTSFTSIPDAFQRQDLGALNFVSIVFNISLDIFTLLWARTIEDAAPNVSIPYNTIYSTFLGCTVLGALISNILVSTKKLLNHNNALTAAILLSAVCLTVPLFAGSDVVMSFTSLCLFRIFTGMIPPAISQLKYNIVPNASRAETYTIFHLPFFQWSHWIDFVLIFVFGPHPDDVAERVFFYFSIIMAASGFMWYVFSNKCQLFPTQSDEVPMDSEDPTLGRATALSSVKRKFYRVLRALKHVSHTIGAFLSTIQRVLLEWPPIIASLLLLALMTTIINIDYAARWTYEKLTGLWRWAFNGGRFPQLAMGSPPLSPIRPPLPPAFQGEVEDDESQAGNFRKFWNAAGTLLSAYIRWGTVILITCVLVFPFIRFFELVSGVNISTSLNRVFWTAWLSTLNLLEVFSEWVVRLCVVLVFLNHRLSNCLYTTSLDLFTTCSRIFFTTIDWSVRSLFQLSNEVYDKTLFEFIATAILVKRLISFFIPKTAFLTEINNALQNAFVSIGATLSEAIINTINSAIEIYNSTIAWLFSIIEHRIPDGWQNSTLVDVSQGAKEFYAAADKILLKKYGWEQIIHDNIFIVFAVFVSVSIIGYCMPWQHIFDATLAAIHFLFVLGHVIFLDVTAGASLASSWVVGQLKRLFHTTKVIVTIPWAWIRGNASRIYCGLPSPVRIFLDPSRYLLALLFDRLKKIIGAILYLTGYLMIKFGQAVGYVVWKQWKLVEVVAGVIDYYVRRAWKAFGRCGRKVWRVWMGTAVWLEDLSDRLRGILKPSPNLGPSSCTISLPSSPTIKVWNASSANEPDLFSNPHLESP